MLLEAIMAMGKAEVEVWQAVEVRELYQANQPSLELVTSVIDARDQVTSSKIAQLMLTKHMIHMKAKVSQRRMSGREI